MGNERDDSMLHIIQNDPEVPPGNILEKLNVPYSLHHPYNGDTLPHLDQISALIVMGGAMGANDDQRYPFLTDLKMLIQQVAKAGIPYLGICLGGQLLATVYSAQVVSHRWGESGISTVNLTTLGKNDQLFRGISEKFTTFQWHNDSFDVPADGVLLASSVACPHQAFRVGDCAWGVQFHPEVTEAAIRNWCILDTSAPRNVEELVSAFSSVEEKYRATSRQLINNFIMTSGFNP
jgi:GMP synthase-like glutamine amidotransferase